MAFVPVANVAQFALCFTQNSQKMQNVFHLLNDSPFDQVSMALACTVFKEWWGDNLHSEVSNTVTFDKIIARALDTQNSPAIEYTNGMPITGNQADKALPANVTVAVKWGTAYAGRSFRGRTYHIGSTQAMFTGNTLGSAYVTSLQSKYFALLTELSSTPWQLVVVSRYTLNAPRAAGVATPITSVSIDNQADSQRRRLTGRGQ